MSDLKNNYNKSNGILSIFKNPFSKNNDANIKQDIADIIQSYDGNENLAGDERKLISNILNAGNIYIRDIMIPRADISAVDINTPIKQSINHIVKNPHSRYPVYNDNLDNVVGMVHIKDILSAMAQGIKPDINDVMRDVLFVVPSMRMLDLLLKMRLERKHLAIVVDEFGGVDGLVTIEDLVEEIVGEIEDEYDIDTVLFTRNKNGSATIDARFLLDDLESEIGEFLNQEQRDEDIDTVGGLLVHLVGRVPNLGEVITHEESGLEFVVKDADPRKIEQVELRNLNIKKS